MSATAWTLVTLGVAAAVGHLKLDATAAAPKAKGVLHDAAGAEVGTIEAEAVKDGLRVTVRVHGIPPGEHGVHVHAGSSCGSTTGADAFKEAGPHFDPAHAGTHDGLDGSGHAGDLGNISVGSDGKGKLDVVAQRLDLGADNASVAGKPVVLHAQQDNLTDTPPNGGSGARLACGVLERR